MSWAILGRIQVPPKAEPGTPVKVSFRVTNIETEGYVSYWAGYQEGDQWINIVGLPPNPPYLSFEEFTDVEGSFIMPDHDVEIHIVAWGQKPDWVETDVKIVTVKLGVPDPNIFQDLSAVYG